ncbi:MAG TPA: tRNA preQ1(34) S-adenosylmethionine ribosyltransferase-isomerase QueA [Burkholderiales bacterium]|nr:tRNA preQ1(34) S-adenosylmethionine ribosyltransferase-isomerase QueA [Burkholderiales bacterium]
MRLDEFDYELPEALIAQHPPPSRGASRLLRMDGASGTLEDAHFRDLPGFLRPHDLLVFNDTRVIKARLFGRKASGGQVEVLVERILDGNHALAQVRASHAPREGATLHLAGDLTATVTGRVGEFFQLRFEGDTPVFEALERAGSMPLPPYITRAPEAVDEDRYQTVFAREPGAVAAPTAGLHFDASMLARVAEAGAETAFVTLHVGAGTFQPVRVLHVAEHQMHSEWYEVSPATVDAIARARARGGRVLAVGTTTLRALESAARGGGIEAGRGDTNLFILPGFRFRVADRLLTNFHLPRSTLMMLVAAFGGTDNIRRAYAHAVENRYRFLSYGDAMLIERA